MGADTRFGSNLLTKMLAKGNNGVTMAAILDLLYEPDA